MMHLKNIKAGNAKTLEQYELTKKHGVIWLYSEDGKNWYEEVKNFQPDTIKIVYDENNIIVAITRDASTLNPEGFSVVEVPDITSNRRADDSGNGRFSQNIPPDFCQGCQAGNIIPNKIRKPVCRSSKPRQCRQGGIFRLLTRKRISHGGSKIRVIAQRRRQLVQRIQCVRRRVYKGGNRGHNESRVPDTTAQ